MNFLADENVHGLIVHWLRNEGHDVLWAAQSMSGQSDEDLLSRAVIESRFILTVDLDFGEMVFHQRLSAPGIVLLRMEDVPIKKRLARIASLMPILKSAAGLFIVITETKLRMRPLTASGGLP